MDFGAYPLEVSSLPAATPTRCGPTYRGPRKTRSPGGERVSFRRPDATRWG
jgi:hypothetical protein